MRIFKAANSCVLTVVLSVFVILGLNCQQSFAALSDYLILYLPFDSSDDEATDQSSYGNDGTVSGASWTSESGAPSGGAYSFDGVNDYIEVDLVTTIADEESTNTLVGADLTIMALVKPMSFNDGEEDCPVVSKWDDDSMSSDRSWQVLVDGTTSGYKGTVYSYWSMDGVNHRSIRSDSKLKTNEWKHIAVVIQTGSSDVYFDGKLNKSSTTGSYGSFFDGTRPLYIGAAEGDVGNIYFHGLIDEVRIYSRALTSSEIKNLAEEAGITNVTTTVTTTSTTTTTVPLYWGSGDGKAYNDFNGDAASDLCIFDDTEGTWFIYSFNTNVTANGLVAWDTQWGWAGAKPVPGDYDGDGIWDLGVFDENTGTWYILSLSNGVLAWGVQWGFYGATVVTGDYNGDGKHDLAVYDPGSGYWYISSLDGSVVAWALAWGWSATDPVSGDYDGDGADDLAVFCATDGYWYIHSLSETDSILMGGQWGWGSGPEPVPGDYNGDTTNDLAFFNPEDGSWYIYSLTGHTILFGYAWGWNGAVPVSGDYDGDGWDDLAVYNTEDGNWYIMSMTGFTIAWAYQWGWPDSKPVAVNGDGVFGAYGNKYIGGDWSYYDTYNGSDSGTMSFTQAGATLSGSLTNGDSETASISGSIDGNDMLILVTYDTGETLYYSATVNLDTMSGAWLKSDGTIGTWSASK